MFIHPKYEFRVLFIISIIVLGFIFISIRLVELSCSTRTLKARSDITIPHLPPILDRNGVLIATNLETFSIYTNPKKLQDIPLTAVLLTKTFKELDYNELITKLNSNNSFVWIKRNLTPHEQSIINKLGIPGIYFKKEYRRVYPQGPLLAHVLGYTDNFSKGTAGMEYYLTKNNISSPLYLTIDVRVQNILREAVNNAVKNYKALGGAGIIMRVDNGEILGLVSLPDYDPNFTSKTTLTNKFNRATLGLYELGSILKLFTVAPALDMQQVTLDSKYNVTYPIRIGKHTIKDTFPTKGELSVTDIIVKSSNIGTTKIALEIGGSNLKKYFETFGFFQPLSIEIPEKSITKMPSNWNEIFSATISYGYGIAPTLLHTLQALAALVNGGKLIDAHLLLTVHKRGKQVIKPSTSDLIRFIMKEAIERGTGKKAAAKGYGVGGKTGTAKKSVNGSYHPEKEILSFIGAFPISRPTYVIALMLDEPKSSGRITGGVIVAPIIKEIVEQAASLLNIVPKLD